MWLFSRAPTQAEALVGGSSRLKFCSAIRSGSHLIGRFRRAAEHKGVRCDAGSPRLAAKDATEVFCRT